MENYEFWWIKDHSYDTKNDINIYKIAFSTVANINNLIGPDFIYNLEDRNYFNFIFSINPKPINKELKDSLIKDEIIFPLEYIAGEILIPDYIPS
jgi:hypothetical protein